ncbi:MAG: hypothetical protein NC043_01015 [Muribaculaceae bacterium]|nr:hypothetical protein [Muribaculaceae bacterium]
MKKLVYLLLALPLLALAAACSDDDKNLPDVTLNVTYKNGSVVDRQVYVVQGDTLVVDSVYLTSNRAGKNAGIVGGVSYWWDGIPYSFTLPNGAIMNLNPVPPYRISVPTDDANVGAHSLTMLMDIAQEGSELASAAAGITVNVVADAADIPSGAGARTSMQTDITFK